MSLLEIELIVSNAFTLTALAVVVLHYRQQSTELSPPLRSTAMSLQTDLDAANAALADAQAKQQAAQAAFDAAQPHLSILQEIEAEVAKLEASLQSRFVTLIDKAHAAWNAR